MQGGVQLFNYYYTVIHLTRGYKQGHWRQLQVAYPGLFYLALRRFHGCGIDAYPGEHYAAFNSVSPSTAFIPLPSPLFR